MKGMAKHPHCHHLLPCLPTSSKSLCEEGRGREDTASSSWGCLRAEGDPCRVLSHSCILLQPTYSWGDSVPPVKLPVCHGLEKLSCPSAKANPLSQPPHCAHQAWRTQHTSLGAERAAKQVARPREKKQINWWCCRACSNILLLPGQGAMVCHPSASCGC